MTRRGRHRGIKILLGVLVGVVVLAGAAELALRLIVPGIFASQVREQLHLSEDHPVEVSLGGVQILSALRGGVGDVTLEVPDAPIMDGVNLDAEASADFVPFAVQDGEIRGGSAKLTVRPEQLGGLIAVVSQGLVDSGTVRGGEITLGRAVTFFGQNVPITATIGLSIEGGDIRIEPRGASAAGFDLSADEILAATGTLLEPILQPQTVCLRDRIPAGIVLTDITLSSTGSASLSASLSPGILSDPAQLEPGSCR